MLHQSQETKLYRASAGFRGVVLSTTAENWLSISSCDLQRFLHLTVSRFASCRLSALMAMLTVYSACASLCSLPRITFSADLQLASCHHLQLRRSNCGLVMTAVNSAQAMSTEAQLNALLSPQQLPPKRCAHHCSSYCFVPCY